MKNLSNLSRALAGICIIASLTSPLAASATTPQQILQRSLDVTKDRNLIHMEIQMDEVYKPYKITEKTTTDSFKLFVSMRMPDQTKDDNEGRIVIKQIPQTLAQELNAPQDSDVPFATLSWKMVNKTVYLQVEQLSPAALEAVKQIDPRLTQYVGQWISFDTASANSILPLTGSQLTTSQSLLSTLNISKNDPAVSWLNKVPLFRALSIDRRAKDAQGNPLWKIRMRLNPAIPALIRAQAIKAIPLSSPYRKTDIKSINTSYSETLKIYNLPRFVALINPKQGTLERLEVGFQQSTPRKAYVSYNPRTYQPIYKNVGTEIIKVNGGLSLLKDTGQPVEPPYFFLSLENLMQQWEAESSSSTVASVY